MDADNDSKGRRRVFVRTAAIGRREGDRLFAAAARRAELDTLGHDEPETTCRMP
ncbi:MAG: hypothetical protein ACYTF6_14465 [Planctomycetota bacterium]|jgi:hypothetical protein